MDNKSTLSSSKLPFNININGHETTKSNEESASEFKEYIIQSNLSLQQINKDLTQKNEELQKELSDKEDELDKEEERLRYIKGLLNNLNEVRKLSVATNQLQTEIYQKSLFLFKRVMSVEHIVYNSLVIYSRIISVFYIFSMIFNLFYRQHILNLTQIFTIIWVPHILINTYYNFVEKNEPFNIFKKGHYKLKQDIEAFQDFLKTQEKKVTEKSQEIKEIEESNLSLEHWISEV